MGFAIFFAMPFAFRVGPIGLVGVQLPLWFMVLLGILWIMQGLAFAIAIVVLIRTTQFRRQPRSAEWLALMVSLCVLSLTVPPPDHFITRDFTLWRWVTGGVALVVSAFTLVFALRKPRSSTIRSCLVCLSALTLMWGPCAVLKLEFTDLFPWLDRLGDGWSFWLVLSVLRFVAALTDGDVILHPCGCDDPGETTRSLSIARVDRVAKHVVCNGDRYDSPGAHPPSRLGLAVHKLDGRTDCWRARTRERGCRLLDGTLSLPSNCPVPYKRRNETLIKWMVFL